MAAQTRGTRGKFSNTVPIADTITGSQEAALAAGATNIVLARYVAGFRCRILSVVANNNAAGVGAGNAVLDIQVNGVSIYTTVANRPTQLGVDTGEFINGMPDTRALRRGDVVTLLSINQPATTGVGQLVFTVGVGMPN